MKLNKKGFTLIELLAVIVVLAVIALIATPIVMRTINNAQEQAKARSLENYAAQLELGYANAILDASKTDNAAREAAAKEYATDNTKGDKPDADTLKITFVDGSVTKIEAAYSGKAYCYTQTAGAKAGACQ